MQQPGKEKLNCWEFMKCGREEGGERAAKLGVCPASTERALHHVHDGRNCGRACWVMEGTLCSTTVQGAFLEKFKKCIQCAFFHYVEAQEGSQLRKASELLQVVTAKESSKAAGETKEPQGPIAVCKGCGQELRVVMDPNWNINIVEAIEFQCRHCGQSVRTRDLLSEEPAATITLNLK